MIFAAPGNPENFLTGYASANLTWSVTATTSGPPRTGIIDFAYLSAGGNSIDGIAETMAVVGGYTAFGWQEGCLVACIYDELLPFTLGTPFDISVYDDAYLTAQSDVSGSAEGDSYIQFSLFEADGVTPVMIEPVPEPGALALRFWGWGQAFYFGSCGLQLQRPECSELWFTLFGSFRPLLIRFAHGHEALNVPRPALLNPVRGDQAFAGYVRVDSVLGELQSVVVRVGLEVDCFERRAPAAGGLRTWRTSASVALIMPGVPI